MPFEHLKSEPLVINAIMKCELPHQPGEPILRSEREKRLWATCQLCWYETPILRPTIHDLRKIILAQVQIPKKVLRQRIENSEGGLDESEISLLNRIEFSVKHGQWSKKQDGLPDEHQLLSGDQKVDFYDFYVYVARLGGYATVSRGARMPIIGHPLKALVGLPSRPMGKYSCKA